MSRSRSYSRKELESLRRADLQNLYKIHGLKGANQKSDALIDTLVSHFTVPVSSRPDSPSTAGGAQVRRLKSIEIQSAGRVKDASAVPPVPRRPTTTTATGNSTSTSTSRVTKAVAVPPRPASRAVKGRQVDSGAAASSVDLEDRLKRLEEQWTERLRLAELAFEEKLRLVEERWEARWAASQPLAPIVHSPRSSNTPQLTFTDPSPLKRPEPGPSSPRTLIPEGPARKKARLSEEAESSTTAPSPDDHDHDDALPPALSSAFRTPPERTGIEPRTPTMSHQGRLDDMSRTPGFGDSMTGLSYPIFATTPKPAEPHSPTLDATPAASRQRAWSSSALPRMLTPGRKRTHDSAPAPAPRAVSQAHLDLTTITESDEVPISLRRHLTPPVFPPPRSRDRTTSPRLSPSPSITETRFQHPPYPTKGSTLNPNSIGHGRPRQSSTPAREYMDVALHGLVNPADSPSALATPSHRTILGTERYRDTRFGDIPMVSWGSPSVDFGPPTPHANARN